jgi:hypothetical protein
MMKADGTRSGLMIIYNKDKEYNTISNTFTVLLCWDSSHRNKGHGVVSR